MSTCKDLWGGVVLGAGLSLVLLIGAATSTHVLAGGAHAVNDGTQSAAAQTSNRAGARQAR